MAHLTPSLALESCETALRQLLEHVLADKHGVEWMTKVFNGDQLAKLAERRAYEQMKRTSRGVAVVSDALIDYTQFFDLLALAEKNWELLVPALGKKQALWRCCAGSTISAILWRITAPSCHSRKTSSQASPEKSGTG